MAWGRRGRHHGEMTIQPRAYVGGRFEFQLDGSPTNAWITSVEGGAVKSEVITEHVGTDDLAFRHTAILDYEPITVKVALAAARPFLQWIEDSLNKRYSRRTGAIVRGDFNLEGRFRQEFYEALITRIAFPALDATSKEPAHLEVEIQPERFTLSPHADPIRGTEHKHTRLKMWNQSMFKLDIQGIDCQHVRKIDAITIKQKVTRLYYGLQRAPEIEPTGIEIPGLSLQLAASHARDFIDWHKHFTVTGARDTDHMKSGFLAFLDPVGDQDIFTIYLDQIGIHNLKLSKSDAGSEQLEMVEVELFVDSMAFKLHEPNKHIGLV